MKPPMSLVGQTHAADLARLCRLAVAGPIVEVGVYQGGTAWHLAHVAREWSQPLHLFDTFTGIPFADTDDTNRKGEFCDTSLEEVQLAIPDAVFHAGIFPDTMPVDFGSVAFVHSDCDQYRSVRAVIDTFWPVMIPGGIMAFDDMDTAGGRKAIEETFPNISQECGWWRVRK